MHGGALDVVQKRFPDAATPWLDLSTGINPWPYPQRRLSTQALSHLPTQAQYESCRTAMAHAIGTNPESIVLAPGSELLIRLLPTIIPARTIAILAPSYNDHARAWRSAGRTVIESRDPLSMADQVDAIVICQPNNPDGRQFSQDELENTLIRLRRKAGWLIVDEAYVDLYPELSLAPQVGGGGLIILRSFGKFFGLAGLRLGGLIAPQSILSEMRKRLGVWPVSGPALEIGAQAYADMRWQEQTRKKLSQARAKFDDTLGRAGLIVTSGTDLFRYVETSDNAYAVWERLARQGIYTRRFDWTQTHLRLGLPPDEAARARLERALSF